MSLSRRTMSRGAVSAWRLVLVASAFVLLASCVSAMYTAKDAVLSLTAANFEQSVIKYDGVALVEFYAPWCGHCQALTPHYKKVAERLKGVALVGAVDCDDASNKKLCGQYQIRGFPTIKIFPADKLKNPYTNELTKQPEDYQGARTAKPMLQAVEGLLTDIHITRLSTPAQLQAFRQQHVSRPQVLLFSSKEKPAPLYNGLSMQLHRALAFALVHESAAEVVAAERVDRFPLLKVIKPDSEVVTYSGDMNGASLRQFLDTFAPPSADDAADEAPPAGAPAPPALPPVNAANLTVSDLAELDAQEDMWLVAFFAASAEECQEHIARYLEVVRELEGVLQLGVVRVAAEQLPQLPSVYGVDAGALAASSCAPQVVLFPWGSDKQDLEEYQLYQGALEAKEVQKWALQHAPDFTTEVTSATYAQFLGGGQGPQDPATAGVRVFLFTNKPESPPLFRALASAFHGKAKFVFGFMNMQHEENKKLVQVGMVPMVALAIPVMKEGQVQIAMEPYKGPLRLGPLHAWLQHMAQRLQLTEGAQASGPGVDTLVPAATTPQHFEQHCASKSGICVIGLLDPSSASYASNLEALTRVAVLRAEQPLHFLQVNAPSQPRLLLALGVMQSDVPTVVALSPSRLRYAVLQEPFSEAALGGLLEDLLAGRTRTLVLQELPTLVDAAAGEGQAAPAAGAGESAAPAAAAEVEEAEEEFDLSDIMGEEVEGDLGTSADKAAEVEKQLREEAERQAEEAVQKAKQAKKQAKKSKKSKKGKKGGKKKATKSSEQGEIHDEL